MTCCLYGRVSTTDQKADQQLFELREYAARMGWEIVAEYVDRGISGMKKERPGLSRLLKDAARGKFAVVLVWKIDRFGRSLVNLVEHIQVLNAAGVRFVATTQGIDTDNKSPMGTFLLQLLSCFAEFERNLIRERTLAGVAEAKRRGVHCGRPKLIWRRDEAVRLREEGLSWRAIATVLNVPVASVRRAVPKAIEQGLSCTKQTHRPVCS